MKSALVVFLVLLASHVSAGAPVAPWVDPGQKNCWFAYWDFSTPRPAPNGGDSIGIPLIGGSMPSEGVLWSEGQSPLFEGGVVEFRNYEAGQEDHYLHWGVYDLPVVARNRYWFFEYDVSIPDGTTDRSHTLYETGPTLERNEHFASGLSYGRNLLPGSTTVAALTFEYAGIPPGSSVFADNIRFGFVEAPVPEPSSLLLLVGGLPLLSRCLRLRVSPGHGSKCPQWLRVSREAAKDVEATKEPRNTGRRKR